MTWKTAISAAVVTFALAAPATALELIKGGKFTQVSNIVLSDSSKKALREFKRKNDAYAAFYTDKNGRGWVWYGAQFTAKDASRAAKLACEAIAKSPCVMIARIDPRNDVGGIGVPKDDQKDYREMLRDTSSSYYAAIAINGIGWWGMSFEYEEAAEAQAASLKTCKESSAKSRANEDDAAIRKAFDRNGVYKCRVIFSLQKG